MDPEFLDTEGEHEHDPSVSSIAFKFDGYLNMHHLSELISDIIQNMGANLYRYKGVLNVAGMQEKFVFQGVGMLFSGNFAQSWAEGETRECRFVFIGKDINKKTLTDGFMACKCEEKLRFNLGDKVKALAAPGWTPGKIIKCWDEGNPYRVELDDENGTNVWAPVDSDQFVRSA